MVFNFNHIFSVRNITQYPFEERGHQVKIECLRPVTEPCVYNEVSEASDHVSPT